MGYNWGSKEWFEFMFGTAPKGYDRWGHQWRASQQFRYDLYQEILKTFLPAEKKIKILDIGCGLGDFTFRLKQMDKKNEITGIDISEKAIGEAKKRYHNITFRVAALPDLPFNNDSFDLVLGMEVIYYLNSGDRINAFENISKILKNNGYFMFSGVLDGGVKYFSEKEIVSLVAQHFEIILKKYNYSKLYSFFERMALLLLKYTQKISELLNFPKDEINRWFNMEERKTEAKYLGKAFLLVKRNRTLSNLLKSLNNHLSILFKFVLSWKLPVKILYILNRIFMKSTKTNIIIICRK